MSLEKLLKEAKEGNVVAQLALGNHYEKGTGGAEKDEKKAFEYYELAAKQGNATAQAAIAYFYDQGKGVEQDNDLSLAYYILAAKGGDPEAQYTMGSKYLNQYGNDQLTEDSEKAVKYLVNAANQRYHHATYLLGWFYENRNDMVKAINLYRDAEKLGNGCASFALGRIYANDDYMPKNMTTAFEHYRNAQKAGHPKAEDKIKELEQQNKSNCVIQ